MTTGNVDSQQAGKVSGKVKWFNNAKGYGFIVADGDEVDMFAHYSAITMEGYKTLKAGQSVRFDTKEVDNGIHAINISTTDEPNETTDEATAESSIQELA